MGDGSRSNDRALPLSSVDEATWSRFLFPGNSRWEDGKSRCPRGVLRHWQEPIAGYEMLGPIARSGTAHTRLDQRNLFLGKDLR